YSRMVLPYFLGRTIMEPHVFTATAARLAELRVRPIFGRTASTLDTGARRLTLDDGSELEYDDLLIATGSSPVRPPIPGAEDGRKLVRIAGGPDVVADFVVMATGIRPNLGWLEGSGVAVNRGVVVDDHLRANVLGVYAAGDVAEGRDRVTGATEVHAIEPTAM